MKSPYLLSIVSGILIGTSYIPFPPWAIFFCFIPLWLAWLESPSLNHVFKTGWVTQFVLTLIGFNWVSHTVHEFGHLPWWASILVLLAFASFCTLSLPLAGAAWWWYDRRFHLKGWSRLLALAVFCAVGERLFPMIFDWHFGYTWLWAKFPAFHLGDVVGFIGLSSIGYLFNAVLTHAWLKRSYALAVSVPLVFVALNILGWWRAQNLVPPDRETTILAVQPNIGNEEKLQAEQGENFRATVFAKFRDRSDLALSEQKADFVVWPETAFPELIVDPGLSSGFGPQLREWVTHRGVQLITGGYSMLPRTRQVTNSFFVLNPQGRWAVEPYHKTMLLAFGEFFPGADLFPKLRQWFPEVGNFGRGPGPTVMTVGEIRLGPQICYEGLFDAFSRQLALKGAQIIVNLTNDSWYGTWQEPYQHLYMTLSRAVEVRRPLVRSTNTGITTAILADGEVLVKSPMNQDWHHHFRIPYLANSPTTPFMGWGYYIFPIFFALTLVTLPFIARRL